MNIMFEYEGTEPTFIDTANLAALLEYLQGKDLSKLIIRDGGNTVNIFYLLIQYQDDFFPDSFSSAELPAIQQQLLVLLANWIVSRRELFIQDDFTPLCCAVLQKKYKTVEFFQQVSQQCQQFNYFDIGWGVKNKAGGDNTPLHVLFSLDHKSAEFENMWGLYLYYLGNSAGKVKFDLTQTNARGQTIWDVWVKHAVDQREIIDFYYELFNQYYSHLPVGRKSEIVAIFSEKLFPALCGRARTKAGQQSQILDTIFNVTSKLFDKLSSPAQSIQDPVIISKLITICIEVGNLEKLFGRGTVNSSKLLGKIQLNIVSETQKEFIRQEWQRIRHGMDGSVAPIETVMAEGREQLERNVGEYMRRRRTDSRAVAARGSAAEILGKQCGEELVLSVSAVGDAVKEFLNKIRGKLERGDRKPGENKIDECLRELDSCLTLEVDANKMGIDEFFEATYFLVCEFLFNGKSLSIFSQQAQELIRRPFTGRVQETLQTKHQSSELADFLSSIGSTIAKILKLNDKYETIVTSVAKEVIKETMNSPVHRNLLKCISQYLDNVDDWRKFYGNTVNSIIEFMGQKMKERRKLKEFIEKLNKEKMEKLFHAAVINALRGEDVRLWYKDCAPLSGLFTRVFCPHKTMVQKYIHSKNRQIKQKVQEYNKDKPITIGDLIELYEILESKNQRKFIAFIEARGFDGKFSTFEGFYKYVEQQLVEAINFLMAMQQAEVREQHEEHEKPEKGKKPESSSGETGASSQRLPESRIQTESIQSVMSSISNGEIPPLVIPVHSSPQDTAPSVMTDHSRVIAGSEEVSASLSTRGSAASQAVAPAPISPFRRDDSYSSRGNVAQQEVVGHHGVAQGERRFAMSQQFFGRGSAAPNPKARRDDSPGSSRSSATRQAVAAPIRQVRGDDGHSSRVNVAPQVVDDQRPPVPPHSKVAAVASQVYEVPRAPTMTLPLPHHAGAQAVRLRQGGHSAALPPQPAPSSELVDILKKRIPGRRGGVDGTDSTSQTDQQQWSFQTTLRQ